MNLSVNGGISIRKPPLMYLINAFSFKLFGINELGLRIPNALFGVGCFGMLAIAVSRVCGISWAALSLWLLLGAQTLIEMSREAQTDTIYVFGFLCASSAVLFDLNNGAATGKRVALALCSWTVSCPVRERPYRTLYRSIYNDFSFPRG